MGAGRERLTARDRPLPTETSAWGELLTRGSVWLALLGDLAGPTAALAGRDRRRWQRAARSIYTAGLAAFLLHVATAFHLFYGWSHTQALIETAKETAAVTGIASGAGLYFNYAFTVLWLLDAGWWWRSGTAAFRRRSPWIDGSLHGFFLFMAFNATVVFETGAIRWIGGLATLALAALAAACWMRSGR